MAEFTPEEIQEILDAFFETMGTRQYIGARYVPIFGRKDEESILWDNSKPYEPLTIVLYQGNSYTSRQYVPVGVEITNLAFWANTGNYNAQVEQYRQEVATFQAGLDAHTAQITAIQESLPSTSFSSTSTVKDYVDSKDSELETALEAQIQDVQDIIPASSFSSTSTVKDYVDAKDSELEGDIATITSDGWVNTQRIADESVTYSKLAQSLKDMLDNNVPYRDEYVIMLGDSYAQGVGGIDASTSGENWQDILISMLGMSHVFKYKAGSAGFVATSTSTGGSSSDVPTGLTYGQMIEHIYQYIAELGLADNISKFVIQGGWNDSNVGTAGLSTVESACESCLADIRRKFPNAKIYVAATYCGSQAKTSTITKTQVSQYYKAACLKRGAAFADTANLPWCFANASNDTVHPTQAMQHYIAGFIGTLMLQGYAEDFEALHNDTVQVRITKNHEIMYTNGVINSPAVDWSQTVQPLIFTSSDNGWQRAFPSSQNNKDLPIIYTAGDGQQYIGMFRFYVDGGIRWLHRGGYQGYTINVVTLTNIMIKFH